jgi:hypothetical protein
MLGEPALKTREKSLLDHEKAVWLHHTASFAADDAKRAMMVMLAIIALAQRAVVWQEVMIGGMCGGAMAITGVIGTPTTDNARDWLNVLRDASDITVPQFAARSRAALRRVSEEGHRSTYLMAYAIGRRGHETNRPRPNRR